MNAVHIPSTPFVIVFLPCLAPTRFIKAKISHRPTHPPSKSQGDLSAQLHTCSTGYNSGFSRSGIHPILLSFCAAPDCQLVCLCLLLLGCVPFGAWWPLPWTGNKFIFPWTVDIITTQTDTWKDSQAKVQVLEKYDPLSHPGRRVFFILRATLLTLYSSVMQSESTLSLWSGFSSDVSVVWF